MKPNKAHVTIGSYDFFLAENIGDPNSLFYSPHYKHSASVYLANRTDITGKPGRQNVRPDVFYFAQDDWSGGLGQKYYNPNLVTNYYRGSGNPRVAGYLTSQPTRTETASPTGAYQGGPVFASGGGYLYMINSDIITAGHTPTIYQTSDMVTWKSAETASVGLGLGDPGWNRQLAVDQNGNCYASFGQNNAFGRIIRIKTDLTSVIFHQESVHATGSNLGCRGLAVFEKHLYGWTGINLYRWDTTDTSLPTGPATVGSLGTDAVSSQICTADVINCGDGVAGFVSQPGRSVVFQARKTANDASTSFGVPVVFTPIWTAPPDVILWSITYKDGTVYVAGNQDRGVTIWAIELGPSTGGSGKASPVARIAPDQEGVSV